MVTKKDQQECFDIFESFLFGDERNKPERDTRKEVAIYNDFEQFISGNLVKQSKTSIIKAMKQLQKCKGIFPKDLQPKTNVLYRGSRMKIKDVEKLKSTNVNFFKFGDWVKIEGRFNGRSEIQSWSTDKNIAVGFAFSDGATEFTFGSMKNIISGELSGFNGPNTVPIIYEIQPVDKNLLFNTSFTNFFSKMIINAKESEVVRLSNSSIKAKIYMPKELFNKYSKQGIVEANKEVAKTLKETVKGLETAFDPIHKMLREEEQFTRETTKTLEKFQGKITTAQRDVETWITKNK